MKKTLYLLGCLLFPALPSTAGVIDTMDTVSGWTTIADAGAVIGLSSDSGLTGNALKLGYTMNSGQFVEISKDMTYFNISGGDQIKFAYRGTGAANNIQIQLRDADGSVFVATLPRLSNTSNWTEVALTYSGTAPDFTYGWDGDNVLDKTKIAKLVFGVTRGAGGSGTLAIDNIRVFLANPANIVMDDFDTFTSSFGNTNKFGGGENAFASPTGVCNVVFVTSTVFSGAKAMELRFDVSAANSYSGYYSELNGKNVSAASHLSFMVKGGQGGERFKIELSSPVIYQRVASYVPVSTSWQEVRIPLSDFTGFTSTGAWGALTFVFENNVLGQPNGPTQGVVYIDQVRFIQPGVADTSVQTLDSMDDYATSIGTWLSYGQIDGQLHGVSGMTSRESDRAIEFAYKPLDNDSQYAVMEKTSYLNVTSGDRFRFYYKGSGGADNIEFKIADKNNTVFIKKLMAVAETAGAWQKAEIPFKEMALFTGTTSTIDLASLATIRFAISKNHGGNGTVWLDDLEYLAPPAYDKSSGKVLLNFDIPYNPFSPNGDGYKDTARFVFTVKESANVTLKIFTLKGAEIYSVDKSMNADAQEHVIEWNGRDKSGALVANGMYLYRILAEGDDGQKDTLVHVLGVIR